jgi:TolB-like protein
MKVDKEYCELFSNDTIQTQLQKILYYPDFAVSDILSQFLSYIVNETISGRSTNIKEYNIGIDVLQKPHLFKPNSNGVVRVHASRLRNALDKYYNTEGHKDECIISIPKGRYVPLFERNQTDKTSNSKKEMIHFPEKIKLAVLPFTCAGSNDQELTFAENIVLLTNKEFGLRKNFTVLSYYTTQQLKSKRVPLKRLSTHYGLDYLVTGSVQFKGSRIRIYVQLIDAGNENQIWSQVYNLKFNAGYLFGLEDKIVFQMLHDLSAANELFKKQFCSVLDTMNINEKAGKNVYFLSKYVNAEGIARKKTQQI